MASMYRNDKKRVEHEMSFQRDRDYLASPVYNETVYHPMAAGQHPEVQAIEQVECTPHMWAHPMGLLRWFQLVMFFILQWLVQITCGGDACTMIMNVFGYTAMGQLFVLIIFLGLSIFCGLIIVAFILNAHRAFPSIIASMEKVYAILGIVFMFIAGILGTWMAVLTNDPEVNYQGRGRGHIKGQWIAAAVIEFLMVIVYIFDFILQRREVWIKPQNLELSLHWKGIQNRPITNNGPGFTTFDEY
ncbi:unnamed protein product [Caenorhabditis sp. 36 PRJEB53466]|nr:unnamed protein product [Caenorhabditis sp. 36 PRJEB53466]